MAEVIIAGGPGSSNFAVIDVTTPASPHVNAVTPGFLGGCAVDAMGARAAVGNLNGGEVEFYDVSNPGNPVKLAGVATTLGGIGAISVDGNRVLVGEMNGVQAALIDFSNAGSPTVLSTFNTSISSIGSIALSGSRGVASGPNDFFIDIIDFSDPANPTDVSFNPQLGSVLTVDLEGSLASVGAQNSSKVALVDIASQTVLGVAATSLAGIFSISIAGSLVAAGSSNDSEAFIIESAGAGDCFCQSEP